MTQALPGYYDDLERSLAAAQSLICEGAKDRRCPAHHPVVATVSALGEPRQRVMILRSADWANNQLRFHTDIRAAKADDLNHNASASVLIYDEERKIQLRIAGTARVTGNEAAEQPWQNSTLFARRCYLADPAPGLPSHQPTSGLAPDMEGRQPDEAEVAKARANFAILLFEIQQIEWLYLANAGHRRALFTCKKPADPWHMQWLVP